jgi:hypothetical protein
VIAFVLAAVVGMQTFMKRGLQARYKVAAHSLANTIGTGDLAGFQAQEQYEPYYAEQKDLVTKREDKVDEAYDAGGVTRTNTGSEFLSKVTRVSGTQSEKGAKASSNIEQGWGGTN